MIYKIQDTTLEGIANAIRAKSGTEEEIQVEDFEYAILNIDTGENTTSAAESAKSAKESADSANTSELAAAEHAGRAAVSEANAEASAEEAKAAAETAAVDAVAKVQELLNDEVEAAQTAANNAQTSESKAASSATAAEESAKSAESFVEVAETQAQAAAESATEAKYVLSTVSGQESEAWAIGTRTEVVEAEDGTEEFVTTPVAEGELQYNNNSKYWCDQAKLVVQDASSSVATANVYAQAEVTV